MGEDRKDYVCTKKCFWNKLYNVGDPLTFKGTDIMLKNFRAKKANETVEEFLGDEPKTFAEMEQHQAQETIDSVGREGLDPNTLAAGQAPVEGPPVTPEQDDVVEEEVVAEEVVAEEADGAEFLE